LIEQGFKNIYGGATNTLPAFGSTGTNSYNQPLRTAVFNINTAANFPTKKFTIPIPPGYVLNLGASGTKTGTAVVQVRPVLANGIYDTKVNLTLLNPTSSTRMNATFSGDTYSAVEVYLTRTSTAASSISLTSMMAQLYVSGATPTLPTSHIMGQGSTGMVFADDAIVETYSYMHPPRKGISTTLVEVEAWRQ